MLAAQGMGPGAPQRQAMAQAEAMAGSREEERWRPIWTELTRQLVGAGQAERAAIVHFPLVSQATKIIYGEDLLAQVEGVKPYLAKMAENPNVQKVRADSKANLEQMLAHYASKR